MTNKEFSLNDKAFVNACLSCQWRNPAKEGKVEPLPATKRQASKWRNGKGLAWKTAKGLVPR